MGNETAFVMKMSNIKYGSGVTREVGFDMKTLGASRVLVVADPNLVNRSPVNIADAHIALAVANKRNGSACESMLACLIRQHPWSLIARSSPDPELMDS